MNVCVRVRLESLIIIFIVAIYLFIINWCVCSSVRRLLSDDYGSLSCRCLLQLTRHRNSYCYCKMSSGCASDAFHVLLRECELWDDKIWHLSIDERIQEALSSRVSLLLCQTNYGSLSVYPNLIHILSLPLVCLSISRMWNFDHSWVDPAVRCLWGYYLWFGDNVWGQFDNGKIPFANCFLQLIVAHLLEFIHFARFFLYTCHTDDDRCPKDTTFFVLYSSRRFIVFFSLLLFLWLLLSQPLTYVRIQHW